MDWSWGDIPAKSRNHREERKEKLGWMNGKEGDPNERKGSSAVRGNAESERDERVN